MNITIHRDGQNFGPYTLDQIKEYLGNGTLTESDLAWHEGCKDWLPVKSIITPLSIPPPPPPIKKEGENTTDIREERASPKSLNGLPNLLGIMGLGFVIILVFGMIIATTPPMDMGPVLFMALVLTIFVAAIIIIRSKRN